MDNTNGAKLWRPVSWRRRPYTMFSRDPHDSNMNDAELSVVI